MKKQQRSVLTTAAFGKAMPFSNPVVHYIILIAVCLLAYANTFHVPFQYDDVDRMIKRPFVQDVRLFFDPVAKERFANEDGFRRRPVGYFTFALNYYGMQNGKTTGFHVVNLAIHTMNAFLVYALVVFTFRAPNMRGSSLRDRASAIAFFSALLFAGHPVLTEAVTYIVQRLTSLATLFYLLSLVLYIKARISQVEAEAGIGNDPASGIQPQSSISALTFYVLSFLSAVLAMKTKEISFTLPLIISLYEFLFFDGPFKKRLLHLVPFLLTMLIIPVSVVGTAGKPLGELMGDAGGMFRAHSMLSRWEYLATEMPVIVTYIRLMFWPAGQSLDHDYPLYHSFIDPTVFLSVLFLSSILCVAVYLLYRLRNTDDGLRLTSFGIFWFFITLSVESSIIPIADVISEHRLYLPSTGFILACTSALFFGAEKLKTRWKGAEKALIMVLAATSLVLAGLTFARNAVWQTEVSLWEDVIQKSPMKARGYNGLGLAYLNKQDYDRAIGQFEKAVTLHPFYGVAFNNLGNALCQKGLYDGAIKAHTKAIELEPDNPVFYFSRGFSYAGRGDYDSAIGDYSRAIAIDPGYADAYNNLGFVYQLRGAFPLAIEQYSRAIALDPRNALLFGNRGSAYAGNGELDRAIEDYAHAIMLNPGLASAYSGRGAAYSVEGSHSKAINDFDRAISLEPSTAELYDGRGVAHMRAGNRSEALADFQHACDRGSEAGCRTLQAVLRK